MLAAACCYAAVKVRLSSTLRYHAADEIAVGRLVGHASSGQTTHVQSTLAAAARDEELAIGVRRDDERGDGCIVRPYHAVARRRGRVWRGPAARHLDETGRPPPRGRRRSSA